MSLMLTRSGPIQPRNRSPKIAYSAKSWVTIAQASTVLAEQELQRAPQQNWRSLLDKIRKFLRYHTKKSDLQKRGEKFQFGDLIQLCDVNERYQAAASRFPKIHSASINITARSSMTAHGQLIIKRYVLPDTIEECHALIRKLLMDQ